MTPARPRPRRIALLGRESAFSLSALRVLADSAVELVAVLVPRSVPNAPLPRRVGPPGRVLAGGAPGLAGCAWERGVPLYEIDLEERASLRLLEGIRPEYVCGACFPRRLPAAWLAAPQGGCLNIHPSLLPAYRGPAPVFWQLRAGESTTGVSVHVMDAGLDTGPLVAQAALPLPEGASADEIDARLASEGARLLVTALRQEALVASPQAAEGASRQPWPGEADLELLVEWSARRAFDFVRGARSCGPFRVRAGGTAFAVREALALAPGARLDAPFARQAGRLRVAFADGAVEFVEAD